MPDKHGWNSWDHYLAIHNRQIENYLGHFILDDQLAATVAATQVKWEGVLYCAGGFEIRLSKLQDVQMVGGRPHVRTGLYSYHVLRRVGDRQINCFRYDNVHVQPKHPSAHHRHRFDENGNEIEPPEHVGEEGWPTLSEVIEEARSLWLSGSTTPREYP